ncbi:MAG: leucine-rich repeat domain-containing protein [Clostridia bacterium]|nr:leucine-rich repeat domain-containing protein [Clostridia bacterium]
MKKKIIIFVALAAIMVFALSFASMAAAVKHEDGIYYELNGSGEDAYAIVSSENRKNCEVVNVVIPATVTINNVEYKVTQIASSAFGSTSGSADNNQFIKTVEIGAYVQSIGHHAFRYLAYLESVKIDNYLAASAISCSNAEFYGSTSLKTVVCTENSKVAAFGSVCFNGCSSLTSVTFPPSLTSLGGSAFKSCDLRELDLSKTQITSIPSWAFGGNSNLSVIKFPSTLISIGSNSLQNNIATTIVFPHSLTTISSDAFGHCYQTGVQMFIPAMTEENFGLASGFLHSLVPNVVFYTGDNPTILKSNVSKLANHSIESFENYDPTKTYTNTIFYNAVTCSNCNGMPGEREFVFVDATLPMKDQTLCTHCGKGDITEYAPIFIPRGYSYSLYGESKRISAGVAINFDSYELYNSMVDESKKITSYGLLATLKSSVSDTGCAFDENGERAGVAAVEFSKPTYTKYNIMDMVVTGFTDQEYNGVKLTDTEVYIAAFYKIGDTYYYITEENVGTTLQTAKSFNQLYESDIANQ